VSADADAGTGTGYYPFDANISSGKVLGGYRYLKPASNSATYVEYEGANFCAFFMAVPAFAPGESRVSLESTLTADQ